MAEARIGRYLVRTADCAGDLHRAQTLRAIAFRGATGGRDADGFDARCRHMLIEDRASGTLVATFRVLPLLSGTDVGFSYAAQHYELSALSSYPDPMLELGRFCLHPDWHDPDILRLAWASIARFVDAEGAKLLFGCTSFKGTDAAVYLDSFAVLRDGHLAPRRWLPQIKAPQVFCFGRQLQVWQADRRRGLIGMPPLLRTYLAMGGWVSDHAVVDADLGTLHVFTGLEIGRIPPARVRALRMLVA